MIYVFNSAYAPKYQVNMLNTLCFPNGWTNEYRYTIGVNAPGQMQTQLKKYEGLGKAIVVYIDRYFEDGEGNKRYKYLPVRLGTYITSYRSVDRLIFKLQLGNFIFPENIELFNENIVKELSQYDMPKLVNSDPENTHDGQYAIIADDIVSGIKHFSGDEAWGRCVDSIAETSAFKHNDQRNFVFMRLELSKSTAKEDIIKPKISNNHWYSRKIENGDAYFLLSRACEYDLFATYKYPVQRKDKSKTALTKLSIDNHITSHSSEEIAIDVVANTVKYKFSLKKDTIEIGGKIGFSTASLNEGIETKGPESGFQYRIKNSMSFWIQMLIAVIFFTGAGIFNGAYSTEKGFEFDMPTIIATVVQALAVLFMFYRTGKRIL
ncbi:MAG: hypothetical protein JRI72_13325 [Deltaproteobacteria bacterium]|nr:hypothetical protein [Deltaproteobacteria bacterium]